MELRVGHAADLEHPRTYTLTYDDRYKKRGMFESV